MRLSTDELARLRETSSYESVKCSKFFEDVETFCMFIGHSRSGHSLVGSFST
jgi:hypothetical protein